MVSNLLTTGFSKASGTPLLPSLMKPHRVHHSLAILICFSGPLQKIQIEVRSCWSGLHRTFMCQGWYQKKQHQGHLSLIWSFRRRSAPNSCSCGCHDSGFAGKGAQFPFPPPPPDCRKWLYSSPRHPQLAHTQGWALMNSTAHIVGYIFQPTKAELRLPETQSSSFRMWSWGHRGQWKDSVRPQWIQTSGTQERLILLFFYKKQYINPLLLCKYLSKLSWTFPIQTWYLQK